MSLLESCKIWRNCRKKLFKCSTDYNILLSRKFVSAQRDGNMKKRRYFAGAAAILFLLLLCGFAPPGITEDKDAQVLLYETYGESEILVYTGRTTVLYRPDGRSAEAPFNGQYAVLHGDTVTIFAETEGSACRGAFQCGNIGGNRPVRFACDERPALCGKRQRGQALCCYLRCAEHIASV